MSTTDVASSLPRTAAVTDRALARVQAASGLVFGVFLILHLANLVAGLGGQDRYDAFMSSARGYYQLPFVELVLVLGAAFTHVGVSIARIRRRRGRGGTKTPPWRQRLHRWTAYYLMAAFVGHVAATRIPGLVGQPADFTLLTFTLTYVGWFFYPYYVGLAFAGAYHLTHGALVALRVLGLPLPSGALARRSRSFWAWVGLCALLALSGVLALGGQLYDVDRSGLAAWRSFYEFVPPAFRTW